MGLVKMGVPVVHRLGCNITRRLYGRIFISIPYMLELVDALIGSRFVLFYLLRSVVTHVRYSFPELCELFDSSSKETSRNQNPVFVSVSRNTYVIKIEVATKKPVHYSRLAAQRKCF